MCNGPNWDLNEIMYYRSGVLGCDPLRGVPGSWMGIKNYSVVVMNTFG